MNFKFFEDKLIRIISPLAEKISNNLTLRAISEGFVRTTPVTLGIAIIAIVGNFPIPAWTAWVASSGMKVHFDAALGASTSILSLYIAFSIAYCYAKNKKRSSITVGFFSLASFVIIMPQTVEGKDGLVKALSSTFLGADGIVVALIVALFTAKLFCYLDEKGIVFKMPSSVPPMVSESLGSVFIAVIIFSVAFFVRVGFAMTSYNTLFGFITAMISIPLLRIGTSVPSVLLIVFLANLVWFFGIHPNTVYGPCNPILMAVILANIEAFQNGLPLPYLTVAIVTTCGMFGGNGNTIGLTLAMFSAKSKRYKNMLKLAFIPNLFNINEPLIFGMPIMLNPIFFIPMTCSGMAMGLVSWAAVELYSFAFNPLMSLLPFTTPFFLKMILAGGIPLLLLGLLCLAVNTLIYYPFFRIADKQAYEIELSEEANEKVLEETIIE